MTKNDVWRIGQVIIDQQLHRNALDDSSIYSLVLVTFFFHIITLSNDDSISTSLEETFLSVLHLARDQILFCRMFP